MEFTLFNMTSLIVLCLMLFARGCFTARIALMPMFGPSHYMVMEKLGAELHRRGHEVRIHNTKHIRRKVIIGKNPDDQPINFIIFFNLVDQSHWQCTIYSDSRLLYQAKSSTLNLYSKIVKTGSRRRLDTGVQNQPLNLSNLLFIQKAPCFSLLVFQLRWKKNEHLEKIFIVYWRHFLYLSVPF